MKRRHHKRRYRRRNPFNFRLKKQTVYTVGAIWLWVFAALITFSFFAEGSVLTRLREELTYQVGWGTFLIPPLLVFISFLFFNKMKSSIGKPNVPLGYTLSLVALLTMTRAGVFGERIFQMLDSAIGVEGAILISLFVFLIGCTVLFNASLEKLVDAILLGVGVIGSFFHSLAKQFVKKPEKAFMVGGKLSRREVEDQPLFKAPMVPPPVPARAGVPANTGGKGDVKMKLTLNTAADAGLWEYPSLLLLSDGPSEKADRGDVRRNAAIIEKTLESFGIQSKVAEVNTGPAVTQYAIEIALGTKVSKITSLSSDLALALAAPTGQVRIEAPIPGRNLVGIEIPNRGLEFVTLKKMLQSDSMKRAKSKLTVALGLDVSGSPMTADIGKMPHVLVAGTTGSGKSVLINAWISSLLFRTTPSEVRLIMIDPKRVELIGYNGIPHLLTPVIVEPDKILSALRWAMNEMEDRYKRFAEVGVRNIDGFNELSGFQAMSYIVIFIDELADLMAYAPVEVEDTICRLAQMARATGIHLVLSTQRPSVDVITGLIKANIPARIAFNVSSMVDSRVIIDMPGAEKLLGRGDMLYVPPDQAKPFRIQGTYVSEKEVVKVVDFFRSKQVAVEYTEEVVNQPLTGWRKGGGKAGVASGDNKDPFFVDALRLVCQYDKASASLLQRRLSVGYARAARIIDQLEEAGIIGMGEGAKPRDVLIKNPDEYLAQVAQVRS